jgi:hypothetical protein
LPGLPKIARHGPEARVALCTTCFRGPNYNSISVHFQDRTVLYLKITPMFTFKPEYCSLKAGDLETIQEWPEIANEK